MKASSLKKEQKRINPTYCASQQNFGFLLMNERDKLITSLKLLDFNDLVKLLKDALENRNFRQIDPETNLPDEELFLLSRIIYDEGKVQNIYVCAVGTSEELNSEGPCETGQCRRCGVFVASSCKIAICPVCSLNNIELT